MLDYYPGRVHKARGKISRYSIAIALIFTLAAAALWVRSYIVQDTISRGDFGNYDDTDWSVIACRGSIFIGIDTRGRPVGETAPPKKWWVWESTEAPIDDPDRGPVSTLNRMGFDAYRGGNSDECQFPLWSITLLGALYPGLCTIRGYILKRRMARIAC